MVKKPIEKIAEDAKVGDLILLELEASVMCHVGCVYGSDYASGFFRNVDDKNVFLDRTQKLAYDLEYLAESLTEKFGENVSSESPTPYPKEDIISYEVLRRYKPNPNDEIDKIIVDVRTGMHQVEKQKNNS